MNEEIAERFINEDLLPYCINRYDVNDFFGAPIKYWTTFTGHNADAGGVPSKEDIASSLDKALHWFYNLESFNGSSSHDGNSLGLPPLIVEGPMSVGNNFFGEDPTYLQPYKRSCSFNALSFKYAADPETFGYSTCVGTIRRDVVALYDGATNVEDNLIGYAAGRGSHLGGNFTDTGWYAQSFAKAGVSIFGFIEDDIPEGTFLEEIDYVEFNGLHFVALAYGLNQDDYAVATLDATQPSAECQVNIGSEENPQLYNAEAEIPTDPLTFWEYA